MKEQVVELLKNSLLFTEYSVKIVVCKEIGGKLWQVIRLQKRRNLM